MDTFEKLLPDTVPWFAHLPCRHRPGVDRHVECCRHKMAAVQRAEIHVHDGRGRCRHAFATDWLASDLPTNGHTLPG